MSGKSMNAPYTPQELMVVAAARQVRDEELVFVGMRLPLLAFAVAKRFQAPRAIGLFECGLMRDEPAYGLLHTMSDPANIVGALWSTRMINLMGLLQQGAVQLGMVGGAEVDRFGNVNTSYIGSRERPAVKLPGSGGAADIASLAGRLLILMPHERHRFRERVDYITSPGYGTGGDWRQRVGLARGGPLAIITSLATISFDPQSKEAVLASYHPGVTPDEIRRQTGWSLRLSPTLHETLPPTNEELRIIRQHDPEGFWARG